MSYTSQISFPETGGPDVLKFERLVAMPGPEADEILVEQDAIGVNFIDTYHRSGTYPVRLPFVPGVEGAGTVIGVGEGVTAFAPGDRVGYVTMGGTYAAHVRVPARAAVKLPRSVTGKAAAAVLLKGLTAWMLAFEIRPARPGDTALVWAPVGGVGSLLVPWLASLGVRVIAVTSTDEKARLALESGADAVVRRSEDVASAVRDLTDGRGVDVAYDSVGKSSQEASLASLAQRGWWISYGNASGMAAPVPPGRLAQGGSLVMTRPTLFHFIDTPERMARGAQALFGAMRAGTLRPQTNLEVPLARAADAHRALESGTTTGSILLLPR